MKESEYSELCVKIGINFKIRVKYSNEQWEMVCIHLYAMRQIGKCCLKLTFNNIENVEDYKKSRQNILFVNFFFWYKTNRF